MVASLAVAVAAQTLDPRQAPWPRTSEIERALAKVKADPNLATEHTITTLKWKSSGDHKPATVPSYLRWILDLFRWLDQSARVLVWVAAGVLAGLLGVYITRLVRARQAIGGIDGFVAPSHVRDLDIRPETLPDDIGLVARALWDRGDHRAALALLYRGMLSRLAHVHRVPIRDSTTEGDCLALAATHLTRERHEYTARLVRVWQRFVYGRETVGDTQVHDLCDGFSPALDRTATGPLPEGSAA
jgi:hypothetical protein